MRIHYGGVAMLVLKKKVKQTMNTQITLNEYQHPILKMEINDEL